MADFGYIFIGLLVAGIIGLFIKKKMQAPNLPRAKRLHRYEEAMSVRDFESDHFHEECGDR